MVFLADLYCLPSSTTHPQLFHRFAIGSSMLVQRDSSLATDDWFRTEQAPYLDWANQNPSWHFESGTEIRQFLVG